MTRNTITDLDHITEALNLTGAIETYLWEELTDGSCWESVEQIINQLESASCSHGSWSDMIYTRDIYGKLGDGQWQDDVDQAIESYGHATGETPDLSTLGEMVTFAVDWVAQELASKLRHLGRFWVVTASVDTMDSHPDVIAFTDESEAIDWVSEEIERRVQHQVDHSTHTITEDDREALTEVEAQLFTITEESI